MERQYNTLLYLLILNEDVANCCILPELPENTVLPSLDKSFRGYRNEKYARVFDKLVS